MAVRNDRSRVVLVLFILFLAVLVIPLLVGATVFSIRLRAIESQVLEANLESLKRNRIIIDTVLERVHERLTRIRRDEGIAELSLAPHPFPSDRILELRSVYQKSDITSELNPYVLETMVYLARPRILMAHGDVYLNRDLYCRHAYLSSGSCPSEWIADLDDVDYYNYRVRVVNLEFGSRNRQVLEVSQSLPISQRLARRGAVYAYIDIDAVGELMASALAGEGGFAHIRLPSGERIGGLGTDGSEFTSIGVRTADSPEADIRVARHGPLFLIELRSQATDWVYVAGIPNDVFYGEARRIQRTFFGVVAVFLIIGLLVVTVLTYETSKPLIRLQTFITAGVLSEHSGPVRPFRYLRDLVNESVKRTSSLERLVEDQKPFMRRIVIDRLFRGDFSSHRELAAFLEHYGLSMKGASYGVACILVEGDYDEVDTEILHEFLVRNALVKKLIADALPAGTLVNDVSLNRIGLVIPYPGDTEQEKASKRTAAFVRELAARLSTDSRISCVVSSGGAVAALAEIPGALEVALNGLDGPAGGRVVEGAEAEGWYHYPPELEIHLSALVQSGRPEEVRSVADQILEENFELRSLPLRARKLLVKDIQATAVKLGRSLRSAKPCDMVREGGRTLRDKARLLLDALVDLAGSERTSGTDRQEAADLVAFVDRNYANPDMGLKLLAREFELTEEYVSSIFRASSGERFADYLEARRMEDARGMLSDGSSSIQHIAEAVGYRSAHAFRRAFKRHFGSAPSMARGIRRIRANERTPRS